MMRTCAILSLSGVATGIQLRGLEAPATSGLEEYNHHEAPAPCDSSSGSGPEPERHSAAWYQKRCTEINDHCKFLQDHRVNAARADRQHLKDICQTEKAALAEKEQKYANEKTEVEHQKAEVAKIQAQVDKAQRDVDAKAHCPPDLTQAKAELAKLEAIANKQPSDIDAECRWQQAVLDAQQCVDELRAREAQLAHYQDDLSHQKADLAWEESHPGHAQNAIAPQQLRVDDACAKSDQLEAVPADASANSIKANCQVQRDDLLALLGTDLARLEDDCARQKRILAGKEETHADEKVDHARQEQEVAAAKAKVDKANADVQAKAHCPPELAEHKAELARLEAIVNKSPMDIDAECEVHQDILVAEKCVDELRAAEDVLSYHQSVHSTEHSELHDEAQEKSQAKSAVAPQEHTVTVVCADWEKAKALWDAAHAACKAH